MNGPDQTDPPPEPKAVVLQRFPPRQVAQMIRQADSQLLKIEGVRQGEILVLTYTFGVGGRRQAFQHCVMTALVASIVDLYPTAQVWEEKLNAQFGVVFQ